METVLEITLTYTSNIIVIISHKKIKEFYLTYTLQIMHQGGKLCFLIVLNQLFVPTCF